RTNGDHRVTKQNTGLRQLPSADPTKAFQKVERAALQASPQSARVSYSTIRVSNAVAVEHLVQSWQSAPQRETRTPSPARQPQSSRLAKELLLMHFRPTARVHPSSRC